MFGKYVTCEQAFLNELTRVLGSGDELTIRGMKVREVLSRTITILDPMQRCYFIPNRNDNIFAKIAETLWMLAGRDDIEWLSYYLPRAKDFSDNGYTWRGAYGPRLRNWNGADKKADQLYYVLNQLNLDPYTRQAVISIWDPSEDTIPVTKDRPCNNWIQFYVRDVYGDGNLRLHMNVAQRSCDIMWGYSGIDTFSWSVLQQMMAFWAGYPVGHFTHFITSLHVYEKHFDIGRNVVNTAISKFYTEDAGEYLTVCSKDPRNVSQFSTPFNDLGDVLEYIFSLEKCARVNPDNNELDIANNIEDEFLKDCYKMLFIYSMMKTQAPYQDIAYVISTFPLQSDFRLAAIEYLTRGSTELLQHTDLSDDELDVMRLYGRV